MLKNRKVQKMKSSRFRSHRYKYTTSTFTKHQVSQFFWRFSNVSSSLANKNPFLSTICYSQSDTDEVFSKTSRLYILLVIFDLKEIQSKLEYLPHKRHLILFNLTKYSQPLKWFGMKKASSLLWRTSPNSIF